MQSLEKALLEHELITLRIIGEWWELDLTGVQKPECVKVLSEALGQLDMPTEMSYLGPEEAGALNDLVQAGGQMPVATFERKHGAVRQMGPGRLEREEPWLDPVSAAEALWYRGFLYRYFDETDDSELVEFYYLPKPLIDQFASGESYPEDTAEHPHTSLSPVAQPEEHVAVVTDAVDDLTAVLASAQREPIREGTLQLFAPLMLNRDPDRHQMLLTLAWEMKFLRKTDAGARPARPAIGWLEKNREEQLRDLADAWSRSNWNELCHTPGLRCEGSGWQNDPILARTTVLDALPRTSDWFQLNELISYVKATDPDFQRPNGNYDTWYLLDVDSGEYLTGFENWNLVEGRLLRFIIQGPLVWLGLVEVTSLRLQDADVLYRLTPRSIDWLENRLVPVVEVNVPIVVRDDATLLVPFNTNRYHRFQVARVSEAEVPEPGKPFAYRITPGSLNLAREQGIDPERLLRFLAEASDRPIPASTRRAIERWAKFGTEGRLENVVILRVREADTLQKLRNNPKTRPYIAEAIGDLAAVVRLGDWIELRRAAAQLGLLLDTPASTS